MMIGERLRKSLTSVLGQAAQKGSIMLVSALISESLRGHWIDIRNSEPERPNRSITKMPEKKMKQAAKKSTTEPSHPASWHQAHPAP